MKVHIEIKLKPFTTPNYVLVDESAKPKDQGFSESKKFSLSELDAATLSSLCDEFRREVFKKAGKREPDTAEYK